MGDGATSTETTTGGAQAAGAQGEGAPGAIGAGAQDGNAGEGAGEETTLLGGSAEAPAEIELKLPDGFQADDELLGSFKASAKELGLKSEGAQKLFDLYAKAAQSEQAKVEADFRAQSETWVKEIRADKEIGGEALQGNLRAANGVVTRFGGKDAHEVLNATGLGNHPAFVRMFARIGKALAEDNSGGGGGGGAPQLSPEEQMFPTHFQKKE